MSATQRLQEALRLVRVLYARTGIISNGYCALCRIGHRLWRASDPKFKHGDGERPMAHPCDNPQCLSHQIEAVLWPAQKRKDKKRKDKS